MPDQLQTISRLQSDYNIVGAVPMAVAAAVILDKDNNVVFDGRDPVESMLRCHVPLTRKDTITAAQIKGDESVASATSAELDLAAFPPGAFFLATTIKHREAIAAVDLSAATAQYNHGATPLGDVLNVFVPPDINLFKFYGVPVSPNGMGSPPVTFVQVELTGATRGDVTAGIIDVWTTYVVREIAPRPPR